MHKLPMAVMAIAFMMASGAFAGPFVQEVSYPGGSERALYLDPGSPKATVILLVGGDGAIGLSPDGTLGDTGNFLARTREHWAAKGIAVVLPDVPEGTGSLMGRRQNAGYAAAVAALVDFAKSRHPAPVFIVGHSQGTNGATSAASRLPPGAIAGLVLASSITRQGKKANTNETVFDANLSSITVPVLILADDADSCALSPPGNAPQVQSALSHAASVKIITVRAGNSGSGAPCDSNSGHGFFGAQNATINQIANWIEAVLGHG